MTTRAMLTYAARGMHWTTFQSSEFQGGEVWYRVELFRDECKRICSASYRREGAHWMPFCNQATAMVSREMIALAGDEMKEAA